MSVPTQEIFRAIVEEMAEGVIFLDAADIIRVLNPAAERIRKVSAQKFTGRPIFDIHPARVHEQIVDLLGSLKSGEVASHHRIISAQGRYFDNTYTAVREADGSYLGTLLVSRDITEKKNLSEENLQLKKILSGPFEKFSFVAHSPAIKIPLDMVQAVAPLDSSVLLFGESGTGKEHFVEMLHSLSARARAPLVNVNCAALPENLIESELFGHVKGAFTGAVSDHPGKFVQAHKGTLFLDEIGELPLPAQAKLLRVLQERRVQAVGGRRETAVDVRIVAATNRDLAEEVRQGRFRPDLYFRLNVIQIPIPPLRERREDIIPLAGYFATHFARQMGKPVPALSSELKKCLLACSFPGNVRQLKHAMERAVALGKEAEILPADLPPELLEGGLDAPPEPGFAPGQPLREALQKYEQEIILAALRHHGSRKSETALSLGISRKALWEKMQRYGVAEMLP
ncbi:sigma-54 interaction domain-containing protein [Trichloromonas sp.]|uniref:sigma-54 interaction domain-containing protein n=1 Tax=Trichloromonas sp. TaxID=3069249 RepID=UPI003D81BC16